MRKYYKARRPEMYSEEYALWRKAVYVRDKFRCVVCGKRGKINAHHLDGWSWAITARYDVGNGATLCAGRWGCHGRFHRMYGKKKNTRFQFEEFLFSRAGKTLDEIIG